MLTLAVFLAGCGGSAAPPDGAGAGPQQQALPAPDPTSRSTFLADARRVCARLDARIARLARPKSQPANAQLLAALDAWELTLDELGRLTPPAAQSKRFRKMLAHFDASIRAARQLPSAKGELSLVPVAVMADRGQKGATIAYSLGLRQCSAFAPAPSQREFERYVLTQAKKSGGLLGPGAKNAPGKRLQDR